MPRLGPGSRVGDRWGGRGRAGRAISSACVAIRVWRGGSADGKRGARPTGLGPVEWWRRRESNPRPEAIYARIYVTYSAICMAAGCAHGQARTVASGSNSSPCFEPRAAGPASSITPRPASTGKLPGETATRLVRPRKRLRCRWQLYVQRYLRRLWPTVTHPTLQYPRRNRYAPMACHLHAQDKPKSASDKAVASTPAKARVWAVRSPRAGFAFAGALGAP